MWVPHLVAPTEPWANPRRIFVVEMTSRRGWSRGWRIALLRYCVIALLWQRNFFNLIIATTMSTVAVSAKVDEWSQ